MYTENIIFPCLSWERSSLTSSPRKKYRVFGKKIPFFQIIQERSSPGVAPFEKTIFSKSLKKISYFRVFFWERSSLIFRLGCKIIFLGKKKWSFPIIQERSYSSAIFLERPSFQDVWQKNGFRCSEWRQQFILKCLRLCFSALPSIQFKLNITTPKLSHATSTMGAQLEGEGWAAPQKTFWLLIFFIINDNKKSFNIIYSDCVFSLRLWERISFN